MYWNFEQNVLGHNMYMSYYVQTILTKARLALTIPIPGTGSQAKA